MKKSFAQLVPALMMLTTAWMYAQEDSIKIQQINVHILKNGKQTSDYYTRNQKTLTMDEQLIREVNFNDSSRQIKDYTLYFYRDERLFTEENYNNNDSLQRIIKHLYNTGGQKTEKVTLAFYEGKPVQTEKTIYAYDNNGILLLTRDYGTGKKRYQTTTFEYDSGRPVKEQSKIRKPTENIILRTIQYKYTEGGNLIEKNVLEKSRDKKIKILTEAYFYNDQGDLEKTEIRDHEGKIQLTKHYVYYPTGGLYRYYELNNAGNMICYYTYGYRKHRINLGTQKSYFEKP